MDNIKTPSIRNYKDGIFAIDSGYIRKEFASIHLIVEKNKVAVVDTGTNHSVNNLLSALEILKLRMEDVQWILLTHIHLDHAGGAGQLMKIFPNARLAVHSRGLRHMINPDKLWSAVVDVYGIDTAKTQYGSLIPIDKDRIDELQEGKVVMLGDRAIEVWDAPGHAKHHVFFRDVKTKSIFTGDTFGISYKEMDSSRGSFVFLSSSPTQFSPQDAENSIKRIMNSDAEVVYLTHYSRLGNIKNAGNSLLKLVSDYVKIAESFHTLEIAEEKIGAAVTNLLLDSALTHGVNLPKKKIIELLKLDIELNTSGLISWVREN